MEMPDKILHTASELFMERGYGNVRMEDIADAAGISKKTLYNHFDSKEALFSRTAANYAEMVHLQLGQLTAESENYLAKIRNILTFGKERLKEVVEYRKRTGRTSVVEDDLMNGIRTWLGEIINNLLEEGKALGMVRADVPVKMTTAVILTLLETHFQNKRSFFLTEVPQDLTDFVENILFKGILTHEAVQILENT